MFWLMVPLIGSRRDVTKMAPAEYGWCTKRIFPLMFQVMAFAVAGGLAGSTAGLEMFYRMSAASLVILLLAFLVCQAVAGDAIQDTVPIHFGMVLDGRDPVAGEVTCDIDRHCILLNSTQPALRLDDADRLARVGSSQAAIATPLCFPIATKNQRLMLP